MISTQHTSNVKKFIGKRSSPCRKCNGVKFYVNPMGGPSCFTCHPPKSEKHINGILIVDANCWTTPENAFFAGENLHEHNVDSRNTAVNASSQNTQLTQSTHSSQNRNLTKSHTYRREYSVNEIAWCLCPGGIVDQMVAAASTPSGIATSRPGELLEEVQARRLAGGHANTTPRHWERSDAGSIAAEITQELRFAGDEVFAAGEPCWMFPGRSVPACDPEADDIRGSLIRRGNEAKRLSVIRLGERLRIVSEDLVRIL